MNITKLVPQILSHPIFKNVDQEIISRHLSDDKFKIMSYEPSSVIITPSDTSSPICIVINGTVEILSGNQDHKVLLKTSGCGTIFGVANLYADSHSFPSVICSKTETKIVIIEKEIFKYMLESEPQIMSNFITFISNKVVYLNKKIASYTVGNNEKKLAYFLLENEINGTVSTEVSISDIAVMLNMGRASLYRAFDKFESENIISRDGRKINVLDIEKLKNYI